MTIDWSPKASESEYFEKVKAANQSAIQLTSQINDVVLAGGIISSEVSGTWTRKAEPLMAPTSSVNAELKLRLGVALESAHIKLPEFDFRKMTSRSRSDTSSKPVVSRKWFCCC